MPTPSVSALGRFARALEDFNAVFIRLPEPARLGFSALSVVHTLSRRGPMRITDLARTEQIKQPALTSAVDRLERDGLVRRRPDPADGRASLVEVTAAGRDVVRSRHDSRVDGLEALLEHITDEERATLLAATTVLERLAAAGRPGAPHDEENDDD